MITVKSRANSLVEDILGNGSGAVCVEPSGRYLDLGLVLNSANIPAGVTVLGADWYDGIQWARNIQCLVQSDRASDVVRISRDSAGIGGGCNVTIAPGVEASGLEGWQSVGVTGGSGLCGFGAMFGLKNASAGVASKLMLRIQLMG